MVLYEWVSGSFAVGYAKSMKVREEDRKNINREISNFMSFTEWLGL